MRKLTMVLTFGLFWYTPVSAQDYRGGFEEVDQRLNSHPQIRRDQADEIHQRSVELMRAAEEIEAYCSEASTASQERRCQFAQTVLFNDLVRLLDRLSDAERGVYPSERVNEDPRCEIARRFNNPEYAERMGVDCPQGGREQ